MKKIENRGRTIDAVLNPRKYPPFSNIADSAAFEAAWASNPDWIFANMAHAAYCDREYLAEIFEKYGATIKFYASKPDGRGIIRGRQAFLAIWGDRAILAFRGTEGNEKLELRLRETGLLSRLLQRIFPSRFRIPFIPTDIVDDLDFIPHTYQEEGGESQVHAGFYKAVRELWPDISKDLDALNLPDPAQVFVTGHSLGAAMAVIAGMLYSFRKIVTFGEPAVGNNLDRTIGSPHIRYVNGDDPVTKIVPDFLYKHHGQLKKIRDKDGPDFRFDHSIINYAIILES